jgi:hypothetical protein
MSLNRKGQPLPHQAEEADIREQMKITVQITLYDKIKGATKKA